MIAANDWHKYQESYMRYGVDLTPDVPRSKKAASKTKLRATAQEKVIIMMLILAIAICCVVMVFLQACASNINYRVYKLNQQINAMSVEIEDLNVELSGYNRLADIEWLAINNLYMTYPTQEQYVYVEDMVGNKEVEKYIATLTESQKGIAVKKNATVVVAAKKLLAQV